MKDQPAWIKMLFKRRHGLNAFKTRFLLDSHREHIEEQIAQDPACRAELRDAALEALGTRKPNTIVQGLAFLLVVGDNADLVAIEPFTADPNQRIQKAAKACLFELRKKATSQ